MAVSKTKDIDTLKITEIKELLRIFNLPTTGKKDDLLERLSLIETSELNSRLVSDEPIYVLTQKGKSTTENVKRSVTEDTDFENQCLKLILDGKFNEAYKLVCSREAQKNKPRGLSVGIDGSRGAIDWNSFALTGLGSSELDRFKNLMDSATNKTLGACIILCEFLGVGTVEKLYKRIVGNNYDAISTKAILAKEKTTKKMKENLKEIDEYKKNRIERYEICCANDSRSCEKCKKMSGKRFYVRDAAAGKNLPPFCDECRCVIVPYFRD